MKTEKQSCKTSVILKKCTCCNLEFPKTEDYFFKKVIKQQIKSGLATYYSFRAICKSCNNKKTEDNRIKKRCKEMNCNVSDYRENWKKQYSENRTKDKNAKSKLTTNQYSRFLQSGLNDIELFINNIKDSKQKRDKRLSEMTKAKMKYFTDEDKKQALRQYAKNDCERLTDSYVANMVLRKPVKELSKEIIETKRLIIKLKRHLNYGN
jgi:transposase-like protein